NLLFLTYHELLGSKSDVAYLHRFLGHYGQRKLAICVCTRTLGRTLYFHRRPQYRHPITSISNLTSDGDFLKNTEEQYFVMFHAVIDANRLENLIKHGGQVAIKCCDLDFSVGFNGGRAIDKVRTGLVF